MLLLNLTKTTKINCKNCYTKLSEINSMDKPFKLFNYGLQISTICPKCKTKNDVSIVNGTHKKYIRIL